MSDDNQNDRYTKNRNIWRKTYSFRRRKPEKTILVDLNTSVTYSIDKQNIIRDRDYFLIDRKRLSFLSGSPPPPQELLTQYDEDVINFNGESEVSVNFNFIFNSSPFVVLQIEDASANTYDNEENVNVYGLSYSNVGLTVGVSAPFYGQVRYRAVYSSAGYPALVTSTSTGSNFSVSAGEVNVGGETFFTASYDDLGTISEFRQTAWNFSGSNEVNVFITGTQIGSSVSSGEISAPLNDVIHFIAYE